jgi:hypothetical protein
LSDKIGWLLRDASGLEIPRAGSEDSTDRADARGDQSAVRQVPDAKGGIDTFLGQVDLLVAERQADVIEQSLIETGIKPPSYVSRAWDYNRTSALIKNVPPADTDIRADQVIE